MLGKVNAVLFSKVKFWGKSEGRFKQNPLNVF